MRQTELRKLRGSRIAYVAQSAAASFNPSYRLIDQYSEGPLLHGLMDRSDAENDAIDLYRRIQLPNPDSIGFRYPHQVSGGQLQRAMTAMAMSCRPDIIIFDEPTTALDVTTQIEVLAAIRSVVEQFGTAAIYITHDLAVVAQMADRIKVLLKGEEVEEASAAEMLASPKENYTKTLWAVRGLNLQTLEPVNKTAPPVLEVQNVSASYGAVPVLKNVSLKVAEGETLALVGESGSGKSTLARVITGLLPCREGKVVVNSEVMPSDFRKRSIDQLRHVQMIYQMADTALNPKQKVRELVGRPAALYLGLNGPALEERVRELLDLIELDPDTYINRFLSELSGGQKQRIGIARALAAEPRLVICDEVTSALDQLVAGGILKLLDRLQRELGMSYLFITHDIETVRAISHSVAVMRNGEVIEVGTKAEIFTPPHHPYTDLLLSSVPEMDTNWLTRVLKHREKEELQLKNTDT
jgi:peptide/nickel transport system ATP-binding protein